MVEVVTAGTACATILFTTESGESLDSTWRLEGFTWASINGTRP